MNLVYNFYAYPLYTNYIKLVDCYFTSPTRRYHPLHSIVIFKKTK